MGNEESTIYSRELVNKILTKLPKTLRVKLLGTGGFCNTLDKLIGVGIMSSKVKTVTLSHGQKSRVFSSPGPKHIFFPSCHRTKMDQNYTQRRISSLVKLDLVS